MSAPKSIWQSRYYAIPQMYMTLVGISPYPAIRNRRLRTVLTLVLCLSILVPEVSYLLFVSADVNDLFECVPTILVAIAISFNFLNATMNVKKIEACVKMIEDDWTSLNTDVERAILQRYAEQGQRMATSYAVFMQTMAFLFILKSVLEVARLEIGASNATRSSVETIMPYRVEYGEKFNRHLYAIMTHCCLSLCAHVFSTLAIDCLYYTLIQHACGMFSIVGRALEDIGENDDDGSRVKSEKIITDDDYGKALNCLRRHLDVIQFADLVESTFTNMFLVTIAMSIVASSIMGMQVIINLNNTEDVAAPIALYATQIVHLFLKFWQAQFLLDYSVAPYDSICRGKWYRTSQRCRKISLLIMTRALLPCKLTANKIITLSIESFGVVLKTSLSYFMVLRSFQ